MPIDELLQLARWAEVFVSAGAIFYSRFTVILRDTCTTGLQHQHRPSRAIRRERGVPMDAAEVRGILKSVYRYRARWREVGHQAIVSIQAGATRA